MKNIKTNLANSFALGTGAIWIICSLVVMIFPNISWQVTKWWMHGVNLAAFGGWNLTLSNFILGGLSLVASAWVCGWLYGWAWQMVTKKK
jgi:hypothetical protein